jgi:TolB protein
MSSSLPSCLGRDAAAFLPLCRLACVLAGGTSSVASAAVGVFEQDADVGATKRAGSVVFDAARGAYTVAGGGANMWFTNDAFHFVWKKVSGDVTLAADITFPEAGGDPHRKACLLIRQSLEPESAYADAALHGDGLTSLQYRAVRNERTYEIQSGVKGPKRLRIEKRGRYVSMSIASAGEENELRPAGGSFRLELAEPFYVGLGVCAHNNDRLEQAVFSRVELTSGAASAVGSAGNVRPRLISTLETVPLASKDRRVVWVTTNHIEAPNWSRDGAWLFFNSRGRIHRISAAGGEPELIDTGFATRNNNDHGISPDGATLVISDQSQGDRKSRIYTLPLSGGTPQLVTKTGPSYWHGWAPDGRTLAYCAERNGEYDVYTIPLAGGEETRLTTAPGLDDGPDYSPDGQWIYFNSDRTGLMQIWRMHTDGTQQEQVTKDTFNNWFPHPSPDGRWLVFLSYEQDVKGHPENRDVTLRVMPLGGGAAQVLANLFGGQGTLNVPSWSPDSRRVAFVSYQLE